MINTMTLIGLCLSLFMFGITATYFIFKVAVNGTDDELMNISAVAALWATVFALFLGIKLLAG